LAVILSLFVTAIQAQEVYYDFTPEGKCHPTASKEDVTKMDNWKCRIGTNCRQSFEPPTQWCRIKFDMKDANFLKS